MSFLRNIFGNNQISERQDFWNELTSIEDLEKITQESENSKVLIFKHSTRCMISKKVLMSFEQEIAQNFIDCKFYYLDILNYRHISNKIAEIFGVTHQSPQVIVLKNKKTVYNASHDNINLSSILAK